MSGNRSRSGARASRTIGSALGVALLVSAFVAQPFGTTAAAAQGPTPMLTVSDTQIPRCGTITASGSSFAPNTKIVMVVSGKTLAERPTSDASGAFTFATSVPCEQGSGSVQVRAFDGTTAVTVEVSIGGAQTTTTIELIETVPAANRIDQWTLPAARVLLLAIAAAELAVLMGWRKRRAHRRATPLDGRSAEGRSARDDAGARAGGT